MTLKNLATRRNIIFLIGLIILLVFFYKISDIAMLFFVGFVLASAIEPAVNFFSRKMHRGFAVLLTFLLGLIILLVIVIPLLNVLVSQTIILTKNFPVYWSHADKLAGQFTDVTKNLAFLPSISEIVAKMYDYANVFITKSVDITLNIASSIGVIVTLGLIVYIMLSDKPHLKNSFLDFFPQEMRSKADSISVNISRKVGGYVTGQIIAMTVTGILTAIGLAIIGVNYAVLIGLIAGLLDIVPVVGPLFALIIAVLVALAEKPVLVIWVLLIFGIVQWLGNTFVRPLIFSKVLELHPLLILFSLIVAGKLIGVVGVIIAPAIAATIQVLVQELYIKQINPKV